MESQWTALQQAMESQRSQIQAAIQSFACQSSRLSSDLVQNFGLRLPEDWAQQWEAIAQGIQYTISELKAKSNRLGALGWTITDDMDFGVCLRLLNRPSESVEKYYRQKYTRVAINELYHDIASNLRIEHLGVLVGQIQTALRRRHYQVALPAAVMLLEAILARDLGIRDQRIIGPVRLHSQTLSEIEYLMWFSVEGFVTEFYANRPFDGPRPSLINRHWVMHGRDDPSLWTKLDVLKVLNAISTILVVL